MYSYSEKSFGCLSCWSNGDAAIVVESYSVVNMRINSRFDGAFVCVCQISIFRMNFQNVTICTSFNHLDFPFKQTFPLTDTKKLIRWQGNSKEKSSFLRKQKDSQSWMNNGNGYVKAIRRVMNVMKWSIVSVSARCVRFWIRIIMQNRWWQGQHYALYSSTVFRWYLSSSDHKNW